MKFNSNKERRAYWKYISSSHTDSELQQALGTMKAQAARVLELHYRKGMSFTEIAITMNRSVTIIRNHHNRGIYKLYRYFNPRATDTA